jgi:hypothetical protein
VYWYVSRGGKYTLEELVSARGGERVLWRRGGSVLPTAHCVPESDSELIEVCENEGAKLVVE